MTTTRFAIDNLIEIPAQHIAVLEILKGTFDAEIERVTALRDELRARQAVEKTLEHAQGMLAEADAREQTSVKTLEEAKRWAQALTEKAETTLAQAEEQARQSAQEAARLAASRSLFDAEEANTKALQDQRATALDLRESQLAGMATKLGEEQRQLALERAAFNQKLEALRV